MACTRPVSLVVSGVPSASGVLAVTPLHALASGLFLLSFCNSFFVKKTTSLKEVISSHLKKWSIFQLRFPFSDQSRLFSLKKRKTKQLLKWLTNSSQLVSFCSPSICNAIILGRHMGEKISKVKSKYKQRVSRLFCVSQKGTDGVSSLFLLRNSQTIQYWSIWFFFVWLFIFKVEHHGETELL